MCGFDERVLGEAVWARAAWPCPQHLEAPHHITPSHDTPSFKHGRIMIVYIIPPGASNCSVQFGRLEGPGLSPCGAELSVVRSEQIRGFYQDISIHECDSCNALCRVVLIGVHGTRVLIRISYPTSKKVGSFQICMGRSP